MRKLLALLFMLSIGAHAADEFTDVDVLGTLTIEAGATLNMGGIPTTDILISSDFPSTSDADMVTAGYLDAQLGGAADQLIMQAKVSEVPGISIGNIVYISGATGGFPQVSLADKDDFSKVAVIAMATETKSNNQTISIIFSGLQEGLDTSAFTEGQVLYLGAAGTFTPIHPIGIKAVVRIGYAVKINASTGSIFFEVDSLTVANDHDGVVRHQLVNQNAGLLAAAGYTVVNDADQRASFSITGTGHVLPSQASMFNVGFGNTNFILSGNVDFVWFNDPTDQHDSVTFTERMRLLGNGNLGIGTATPSEKLDIVGTVKATGLGMGGITTTDIFVSTDGASTSDAALVTAGYVDARTQTITLTGDVTGSGTGSFATTIAAGAVDVAMLADGTDGELITWSATGAATTVAVGTATHVLTSNGVGVAPTFQAPAGGGGRIVLHEVEVSGGAVAGISTGTITALTDGKVYPFECLIKSAGSTTFRTFVNGDNTNGNYRRGLMSSSGTHSESSTSSGVTSTSSEPLFITGTIIVFDGRVSVRMHMFGVTSPRNADSAMYHASATSCTEFEILGDAGNNAGDGSILTIYDYQ